MAVTRAIGQILPDLFKVVDLGERFLGLGTHTAKHRKQIKAKKRKLLLPVVKRIIHRVLSTRGIRSDTKGLKGIQPKGRRKVVAVRALTGGRKAKTTKKRKAKPTAAMRKRRRGGGGSHTVAHMLHGGTGDLKPQYMTLSTDISGDNDKYTQTRISLPVSHFGDAMNKTTIFEILRVEWYMGIENLGDVVNLDVAYLSTTSIRANLVTCTLPTVTADVANSLVIAPALRQVYGTGGQNVTYPICVDTSDNAGNGMLVATDVIFITHGNVGGTVNSRVTCKILYRLSRVGITEYVGILQSQQ